MCFLVTSSDLGCALCVYDIYLDMRNSLCYYFMVYAECQTCRADLSILSSMVLAYTSKILSIINVDFNIVGYLLIRYSEYVSC